MSATIVQRAEGREGWDPTHDRHKRICGEVADKSGGLMEVDLTGSARALGTPEVGPGFQERTWG